MLSNRITNAVSQYRAKQAAETAERRMRELAEETDDVLWLNGADWETCHFVNSADVAIWGQSISELKDDPTAFLSAIHPDDREIAGSVMTDLSEGTAVDLELRINQRGISVVGSGLVQMLLPTEMVPSSNT